MSHARLFSGLLALATLSCSRSHGEPVPAGDRTPASASANGSPSSSAVLRAAIRAPAAANAPSGAKPITSAGAPVELSEPEKEADLRYHAALERGRRATLAKHYDAADIAFTEALTAHKSDTRALGERGFARMQAGHLDLAMDDFLTADGRTRDPALAAQIFFNQGLLAERQGDLASAKVAYARSQQTHATSAAKSKLAALGGSACTAAFVPLSQPLEHYASWVAFWDSLGEMDKLTTDEEVKKSLAVEDCKDACAVNADEWHIVMPTPSGLDVLRAVDRGGASRCSTFPQFELERRGSILRFSSTNEDFEVALCDDHCNNDDGLCPTCCADGPTHRYDTFVDLSAKRAVLRVSQYAAKGELHALPITLDAQNVVHVSSGACDRAVPLTAK